MFGVFFIYKLRFEYDIWILCLFLYRRLGKVSTTGKSYSFRSCVRACDAKLRVPAGRCCSQRWVAGARKMLRVPAPAPASARLAGPGWPAGLAGWPGPLRACVRSC